MSKWSDSPAIGAPVASKWMASPAIAPQASQPAAPQPSYEPSADVELYGMQMPESVGKFLVGAGSSLDKAKRGITGLLGADTSQGAEDAALYQKHRPEGWQTGAGEITGDLAAYAPLALVPGGAAAQIAAGAAGSAALTPGDLEERAKAAALGGAGAAGGQALAKALGRIAKPVGDLKGPRNDSIRMLQEANVDPTFGQVMGSKGGVVGRGIGRVEEAMQSMPLGAGSPIRARRAEALSNWQKATREAAMPPAPPGGFELGGSGSVDAVREATSEAYNAALKSHPLTEIAATHTPDIDTLAKGVAVTPEQKALVAKMFGDIQAAHVDASDGSIAAAHAIESDLKTMAARYSRSQDPSQQDLGRLFDKVAQDYRKAWRSDISPDVAKRLGRIDEKYPSLLAIEDSARKVGAAVSEGDPNAYTPAVLLRGSRNVDRSAGKGNYIAGEAPQQELAAAGQKLLGNRVGDSGTAERQSMINALGALAIGGAGTLAGGIPGGLATLGGVAAYGTKPVQNYLTGRAAPKVQAAAYELAKKLRKPAGIVGAATVGGSKREQQRNNDEEQ